MINNHIVEVNFRQFVCSTTFHANNKENTKAPHHWLFVRGTASHWWVPALRDIRARSIPMSWRPDNMVEQTITLSIMLLGETNAPCWPLFVYKNTGTEIPRLYHTETTHIFQFFIAVLHSLWCFRPSLLPHYESESILLPLSCRIIIPL